MKTLSLVLGFLAAASSAVAQDCARERADMVDVVRAFVRSDP